MTVTNIDAQAIVDSKILAEVNVKPMVSVAANATRSTSLTFGAETHAKVSDVAMYVTIQFRNADGTPGQVSCVFSCFGCWDY